MSFLAATLLVCAFSVTLQAEHVDPNSLQFSTWQTTRRSESGTAERTRVTLKGNCGEFFSTSGRRGTLTGLRYEQADPEQEDQIVIRGRWRSQNGSTGTFVWYVSPSGKFTGTWQRGHGGPEKVWDGYRLTLVA